MVRVHVLGRVGASGDGAGFDERDLPGVQGTVAFVVLVVERRPLTRDALADVLWPEVLPAAWPAGLSAILSKVRSLITRVGIDRSALVSAGGTIELRLPADTWVDSEDAVARLDRAMGAHRRGDLTAALADATAASAALRRPLLPGIDNPWAEPIRQRFEQRHLDCLDLLARCWLAHGDARLALTIAQQSIDLQPLDESPYRTTILAHRAMGNAALAAAVFQRCRATMREELGIEPSPETVAIGHGATDLTDAVIAGSLHSNERPDAN